MTKSARTSLEIAHAVANEVGVSRSVARDCVKAVVNGIVGALLAGQAVRIDRLGVFKPITRPQRKYRDPRNGEMGEAPTRRDVNFKAAVDLKEKL